MRSSSGQRPLQHRRQVERPQGGRRAGTGKRPATNEGRDGRFRLYADPRRISRHLLRRAGAAQSGQTSSPGWSSSSGCGPATHRRRADQHQSGARTCAAPPGGELAVGDLTLALRLPNCEELDRLQDCGDPEIERIEREIACLRARREAIPFIDPFDLRYSNRIRIPNRRRRRRGCSA